MLQPRFARLRTEEARRLGAVWRSIARARRGRGRRAPSVHFARGAGGWRARFPSITAREGAIILEEMARINASEIRTGRVRPLTRRELEARQIRYMRNDPGEDWQLLRQVRERGGGDCEDLAAAIKGSLLAAGRGRRARIKILPPSHGISHVVVECGNGEILDPSIWGGMGAPDEFGVAITPAIPAALVFLLEVVRNGQ